MRVAVGLALLAAACGRLPDRERPAPAAEQPSKPDTERQTKLARAMCKEYYEATKFWRVVNKRYPESLKEMEAPLRPGEADDLHIKQDPWGNDYMLLVDGKEIQVTSFGPDGQEATDDDIYYPETK